MGGLLSKLRQHDDGDYEKILEEIHKNLRKAELDLSEVKVRERRVVIVWLLYSVFFYLIYLLAYALYLRIHLDGGNFILATVVLPVAPLGIYLIRNLIYIYYERRKATEKERVENLQARQKGKLEELKKKSSYYTTKSLLERYDNAKPGGDGNASTTTTPRGHAARKSMSQGSPSITPNRSPPNTAPGGQMMHTPSMSHPSPNASPHFSNARARMPPKSAGGAMNEPSQAQTPSFNSPQRSSVSDMGMPTPYARQTPQPRAWYDKLVDVVIGDEGPDTKYALICEQCFAHNGLVASTEYEEIQYVCPKCSHFNPSRRKRRDGSKSTTDAGDLRLSGGGDLDRSNHPPTRKNSVVAPPVTRKAMLLRNSSATRAPSSPRTPRDNTPRVTSRLRHRLSPSVSPSPNPSPTPAHRNDDRDASDDDEGNEHRQHSDEDEEESRDREDVGRSEEELRRSDGYSDDDEEGRVVDDDEDRRDGDDRTSNEELDRSALREEEVPSDEEGEDEVGELEAEESRVVDGVRRRSSAAGGGGVLSRQGSVSKSSSSKKKKRDRR